MTKKYCQALFLMALCFCQALTAGPLAEKAAIFDEAIEARHMPLGLVVNLQPLQGSEAKFSSSADSTIWTGSYIAAQIYRFRVTGERQALANAMKGLQAFVALHEMSGEQGFMGRCFGEKEQFNGARGMKPGVGSYSHLVFRADTSRDQYTGIFLGCAVAWQHIDDNELKEKVRFMLQQAGLNLCRNNLALTVKFAEETLVPFNLNPDYAYQDRINPAEWSKVDDFPANVFAQAVPYSERLARVIAGFRPPPVRGGEALRALMMLDISARITSDREIETFVTDELLTRRRLDEVASACCLLLSDVFYGRGTVLVYSKLHGILRELLRISWHGAAIRMKVGENMAKFVEPAFMPFFAAVAGKIANEVISTLDFFRSGDGFALALILVNSIEKFEYFLQNFQGRYSRIAARLRELKQKLVAYSNSNIDEFADTMRSYVGCNLTFLALLGILEQSENEKIRAAALSILPRAFADIADEKNSLYTFIAAAFSAENVSNKQMTDAIETLRLYPLDQLEKRFAHDSLPLSPWPDRFGRVGRQSRQLIPVNLRAPHIFIWQEPPRSIYTGSDSGRRIAPVGYLLAYWFARYHDLIDENL